MSQPQPSQSRKPLTRLVHARAGTMVVDCNGVKIGVIAAAWGAAIQVTTPNGYRWIPTKLAVETIPGQGIRLQITAEEADRY
jgi:hypothetical protein